MKNCLHCGCWCDKQFCSVWCRERYAWKKASLSAPTVMELYSNVSTAALIEELVEIWEEDHTCPETCNSDPNLMCYECYYDEGTYLYSNEYRETLKGKSLNELKELRKEFGS